MYSPEERERIVNHVCAQISQKRPLYKVLLEDEGMPDRQTLHNWCVSNEDLFDKVIRARELGMEANIEEMIEIADDCTNDVYIDYEGVGENRNPVAKIDGNTVARAKARMFAREKAAQMLAPRRFGAKVDVTSGGEKLEAPTTTINDNRVQSLIAIALDRRRQDDEMRKIMDD